MQFSTKLRRAVQRPSAPQSESPDEKQRSIIAARHEFANAFGDLARGKRNWQLIAFGVTGVLAIVAVANLRLVMSARVVPYVVQVDRFGQIVSVGAAEAMAKPDQRLLSSQLAQFIRSVRGVLPSAAAPAQREMLRRAYAFAAPEAAAFLNEYFSIPENDPRALGTRLARQVDVTAVLPVPNSSVWRMRWTETERWLSGADTMRRTEWEAYLSVKLAPPARAETIQENPLGIYVTSISWTQLAEQRVPLDTVSSSPDNAR